MEYLQYFSCMFQIEFSSKRVLNLVISGIPSIRLYVYSNSSNKWCFKPCYKWNTFNTNPTQVIDKDGAVGFKPCYKWNTFNTCLCMNYIIN